MCVCACESGRLCLCVSAYMYVCLCACLCVYMYVCLCACLSVCVCVCVCDLYTCTSFRPIISVTGHNFHKSNLSVGSFINRL